MIWDGAEWKRTTLILFAGRLLPPAGREAGKVSIGREDQAEYKELLGFAVITAWI